MAEIGWSVRDKGIKIEIETIKRIASDIAACAAARALSRDWQEHPMFGINVDKDRWAISFQESCAHLDHMLHQIEVG